MEAVHAGTADPGPAMPLDAACETAARECGRSVADVRSFARKTVRGPHSPRVYIAGPRRTGLIIAREDDPARAKMPASQLTFDI